MPVWVFLTFFLKFQEAKGVERTPQEWSALLVISCQGELGINMMLFTFIACVTCQVSPLKMYCFSLSLLCSLKMSYWVYPPLLEVGVSGWEVGDGIMYHVLGWGQYSELICMNDLLSLCSDLFIYVIIYIRIDWCILYGLGCISMLCFLLYCSDCFSCWEFLYFNFCIPFTCPYPFVF